MSYSTRPRPPRRTPWGTIIFLSLGSLLFLVVLALFIATGKTDRDEIGLVYGGGPFEGRQFQQILQPGSPLTFLGWFDPLYTYPVTQRSYIISENEGDLRAKIGAASKDRVTVSFEVATYFKLNTDKIQKFHEILGLKYGAWTPEGWLDLLQESFQQQIEFALQRESRRWDIADLFASEEALLTIQRNIGRSLKANVEEVLGDEYFCGVEFEPGQACSDFTFVVKSVTPPEGVVVEFQKNKESEIAIQTKLNEVQQRTAEASAIEALNRALESAGQNYVLLRAIEEGKINFWVVPSDTGLALTTPTPESP